MAKTLKEQSRLDANQVLKNAFNDVDSSLTTTGFLTGKVGHKVQLVISTTSIANDTETFSFYDTGVLLYSITIIYTSAVREQMISAERTA